MQLRSRLSRRNFLTGLGASAGTVAVATMAAGCGSSSVTTTAPSTPPSGLRDADILNFALNLEYLEAEFYLRATTNSGLSSANIGISVARSAQLPAAARSTFTTPAIKAYALEIANDELLHVEFLRSALGSAAVDRPAIDLTNSFNAAAMAAGIGPAFNPFADENSFIVGAFVFEDVGVTAYHGAATLISNKTYLGAAAGIMAVEAYHAAEIRTVLAYLGDPGISPMQIRSPLSAACWSGGAGTACRPEAPISLPADTNSIAYDRTTTEVLHIVYCGRGGSRLQRGLLPQRHEHQQHHALRRARAFLLWSTQNSGWPRGFSAKTATPSRSLKSA